MPGDEGVCGKTQEAESGVSVLLVGRDCSVGGVLGMAGMGQCLGDRLAAVAGHLRRRRTHQHAQDGRGQAQQVEQIMASGATVFAASQTPMPSTAEQRPLRVGPLQNAPATSGTNAPVGVTL